MFAEKMIVETDESGHLKSIPALPPNKRIETIFLVIGEIDEQESSLRKPCRELKGKISISGNIVDSVSEDLWNLPK